MSATACHEAFFIPGNTHEQHLVAMVPDCTKPSHIVRVAFLRILHIISDEFYQQMYVKGSLKRCIRFLIYINMPEANQKKIVHTYLREAKNLRPDLVNG